MMNRRAFLSGIAAFGAIAPLSAIAANNAGPLMTRNNLADLNDPAAARLATVVPTYVPTTTAMAALNPAKDLLAVLTATGAGGAFEVLTLASLSAGEQAAAAADNAARRICYVIPTADATKVYRRIYSGPISVLWAGAVVDGTTNDTPAIQATINLCNALGGGDVLLGIGTSLIKYAGTTNFGFVAYCLMLKTGVTLRGYGIGVSILKISAVGATPISGNTLLVGVSTNQTGTANDPLTFNVGTKDFQVSGDAAVNYALGYSTGGVWIYYVDGYVSSNVFTYDTGSFGMWPRAVTHFTISGARVEIPVQVGAGGASGLQTSNCAYGYIQGYFESISDDCFVIDASNPIGSGIGVSHDIIADVVVNSTGRGSGVRLLGTFDHPWHIYNINIRATIEMAATTSLWGVTLDGAIYDNIHIDAVIEGGHDDALHLDAQTASGYTPAITNSSFKISVRNCEGKAVACYNGGGGIISNNTIEARIYNPAILGGVGMNLYGDEWRGSIQMDYDPAGTKPSPGRAIDLFVTNSNMDVSSQHHTKGGMYLRSVAQDNTWRTGSFSGATGTDFDITGESGSLNNTFIGGNLASTHKVNVADTTWAFYGQPQFQGAGTLNASTDGSGHLTIPHGLAGDPRSCSASLQNASGYVAQVIAHDATNLTVLVFNTTTGAALASTGVGVSWGAQL